MHKKIIFILLLVAIVTLLTGCFAGDRTIVDKPAGFFTGIWHGWVAPLALIGELFDSSIRIYEPHNRGFLYDLGFYLAIIGGFGSLAFFRDKRK